VEQKEGPRAYLTPPRGQQQAPPVQTPSFSHELTRLLSLLCPLQLWAHVNEWWGPTTAEHREEMGPATPGSAGEHFCLFKKGFIPLMDALTVLPSKLAYNSQGEYQEKRCLRDQE
jgi:hypothetical protein